MSQSRQPERDASAHQPGCLADIKLEPISSAQCQHKIFILLWCPPPINHCPSRLPGQVAPCSPSWQEQTLGAMQMPLPQPKEQRAERKDAREGLGTGNAQHRHVLRRLGVTGMSTYAEYNAHRPWKGPSQGSSHSRSPRGRHGGRDDAYKKRAFYNLYDESDRSSQLIHWSVS